jgi:hypothetical protein
MMAKYRKKPVVIEAVQFFPETAQAVLDFIGSKWPTDRWDSEPAGLYGNGSGKDFVANGLWVKTLEGKMTAMPGDWIIKGVKGEFYPCKPDIFEASYDPA